MTEDFNAVWSFWTLSENEVANICESSLKEGIDGRCEGGLRSSRALIAFQILRGLAEHEEIKEALKCFFALIIAE